MNSRVTVVASAALLLLVSAPPAQPQAPPNDSLGAQLTRCAALTGASARLACYDALARTSGTIPAARLSPMPAAPQSSPAPSAPAAPLATPAPSAPAAGNAEFGVRNGPLEARREPVGEKRLLAVVSRVAARGHGELVLTLDNGQVWTQIEAIDYPVKPGDHVEIDVGALGSYVLWSPAHRRATKVTRIN